MRIFFILVYFLIHNSFSLNCGFGLELKMQTETDLEASKLGWCGFFYFT